MKNKISSFWESFKKIWMNKRYRSIIILCFYLVFFGCIFFILNIEEEPTTLPKEVEKVKTSLEKYSEMTNYEFTLKIDERKDNKEATYIYNGKTNNEVTIINEKYYLKDNVIYEIVDNQIKILSATLMDINVFKLRPSNVNYLLSLGELNYETKYADGSIEKSYLVPLKEVIKNFKGEEIADPKTVIEIKYKEKDNQIIEIVLDLSNYQQYIYKTTDLYMVTIDYTNIGQVEPLKEDYPIINE